MEPLFKIGQKVTVKHRKKSESPADYPCSYVKEMTEYSNKKVTIISYNKLRYSYEECKFKTFCDGFYYNIKEDGGEYVWSSSMFKEAYEL